MQLACTCSSLVRAAAALAAPRVRTQQRSLMRPAPGPQRPSRSPAAAVVTTAAVARPGASSDDVGRDFASSLALMVLGAALLSERVNGCGIVAQLELDHPHIEPLLLGIAGVLALAAAWPARRKAEGAVEAVRQLAGRAAFGGLSAALAVEVWTGKGLLALLEIETGAAALSEAEALLAALLLLVLTGPRKPSKPSRA